MWRLPTLPPAVSRVRDAVSATIDVLLLIAFAAFILSSCWEIWGWPGLVAGPLVMLLARLLWPMPVLDDEGCSKCEHASLHHHGNCQACLRQVRAGEALVSGVPCGRFVRWSPRNRWGVVRSREGTRAKLRAL